MTEPDFDVVVVGGGVIGLSVAYHCARLGFTTAIVERHERFCQEASTHNSGVIHAGFNPPSGSLKARLNLIGLRQIYRKSVEWKFGTRKVGTLVVGVNDRQKERLRAMKKIGEKNGLDNLQLLDAKAVGDIEPEIRNVESALYSPDGGVIDIMEYAARLQAHASNEGVALAPAREVVGVKPSQESVTLSLSTGEDIDTRFVVNSAGLHADDIAAMFGTLYRVYPCVGEYAYLVGSDSTSIRGMVYPVVESDSPGLGVHLTRTFDSQLQIGPTAVYGEGKDPVSWKRTPLSEFFKAARLFLPEASETNLREGWSGVRAKTVPPGSGSGYGDFVVEWDVHGYPAVHLVGIESPGLTSSLAIGELVATMVEDRARGVK